MGRLKYGPVSQLGISLDMPVAALQYFHERGGAITYADASGHQTLALTATASVFGWLELGISADGPGVAGAVGSQYWLSSATAGADSRPCRILNPCEAFWMPADATPAQTDVGNACDLIGVNDGTKQTADIGTSSTDILRIIHQDGTDVLVMVNPAKLQADT